MNGAPQLSWSAKVESVSVARPAVAVPPRLRANGDGGAAVGASPSWQ